MLKTLFEIPFSTTRREISGDFVNAKRTGARENRLRRLHVTQELSSESHVTRHSRQVLALFVDERRDYVFHGAAHLCELLLAKNVRVRKVSEPGDWSNATRN